jgi:hypothetical protein
MTDSVLSDSASYPVTFAARSMTRVTESGSEISPRWPALKEEMVEPGDEPGGSGADAALPVAYG